MNKPKIDRNNPAPDPDPSPTPAGLKKFDLAGFAQQSKSSGSARAYPVLPDSHGEVSGLVASILEKSAQLDALEGALDLEKAELIALAKPFYFQHHSGQRAVATAVEARSADGKVVRVGFANAYRGTSDEAALVRIAGEHATRYFGQSFEIKIKGDLIPEAVIEPLLAELRTLFSRHGAAAALVAKALFKPRAEFHVARHSLFTVQENQLLDKVVPIAASVKTKLRRNGTDED